MKMKSNLSVEVEFLAGTGIREAVAEAKQKAIKWNVAYITFKFNTVKCNISQNCIEDKAVSNFHRCIEIQDKELMFVVE